ncbi:MAG: methyltransferase domain-containing protein [Microcoleaceae cyanobacterium]
MNTLLNELVLEQYNSRQGQEFYRKVMGDDGHNIHYGLYNDINDSMHDACEKIIYYMSQLAQEKGVNLQGAKVLELGSGNGGAAHYLSKTFDCFVTCVNLCPEQNKVNLQRAEELGISDKINILECDFETLPESWQESFDLVWSEEAFCHAKNRQVLFAQIAGVLKEKGVLVFTDIMSTELGRENNLNSFSDRNAVKDLATPTDYFQCSQTKFKNIAYQDLSHHLPINFRKMIQQIDNNYQDLIQKGVSANYLDSFRMSLKNRLVATDSGYFSWGCFVMNK